ncbi:MAG: DinB family protein [Bacteroidota bacterium]
MQIIPMMLKEMEQEAHTTRKMLARIPEDKYDWQPHTKSMKMINLATHIAELTGWVAMCLNTTELDFETSPYQPAVVNNNAELMDFFETNLATGKDQLAKATEEQLMEMWTMRSGATIYVNCTKVEMIRSCYSQVVHHRAQLGVYLRLLDVAIPGSYGPSADEMSM